MFSWEYPPKIVGGLGTHVHELSKALAKLGHEVHVLTLPTSKAPDYELMEKVHVHRVRHLNMRWLAELMLVDEVKHSDFLVDIMSYNVCSAMLLAYDIDPKYNIDLIHAHDWLGIIGAVTAKRLLAKPLILTMHSTELGRSRGKPNRLVSEIEKLGSREADKIITVSQAMKNELTEISFPSDKIQVIYNGIDVAKYRPEISGEEVRRKLGLEGKPVILFIGRLTLVKGGEPLVKAMPRILEHVPEAKLIIVGVGELEGEIRTLVKGLHLEDAVKMITAFLPEEERIKMYAAADVCVFPSLYEPFGIVALEAMAMGKPVVASRVGGLQESVMHGKTGFLVKPEDSKDLSDAIIVVLKNSELAREFGLGGRERAVHFFDWSIIAKQVVEAYGEIMK